MFKGEERKEDDAEGVMDVFQASAFPSLPFLLSETKCEMREQ